MSMLRVFIIIAAFFTVTACANTIKGAGQDAANTVDAAQGAANDVADAVE